MNRIKIALVDDQKIFRQSLAALISTNKNFELTGEYDNGHVYLGHLSTLSVLPDITIIDMEMPGINGMELNVLMQKKYPAVKVIVLSIHTKERIIAKMIEQGASGYLVKTCDKEELFSCIQTVYQTGFYINQQTLQAMRETAFKNKTIKGLGGIAIDISKREKEILRLICNELSAPEIAEKLFISMRTVEGHRNNLLAKTGCRNTAGLVLFAIKSSIFDLPL